MKYYGVFHFTAKVGSHKEHILSDIYFKFIKGENQHELEALNKTRLATSRSDENLKMFLTSWRDKYKQERALSLSHIYSTKYLIHECDENGIWKPTKMELEEAKYLYKEEK